MVSTSARLLAQAARDDGWPVDAFDVFGDIDTRRAARCWRHVGHPEPGLRFHGATVLAALRRAREEGATGWIAGSGFEQQPALLGEAARTLPLFGTAPADARRIRQPRSFFAALSRHGIVHPPVVYPGTGLAQSDGWLHKHFRGSGGWRVEPLRQDGAASAYAMPGYYAQRRVAGVPMSALFVANGIEARTLGWSQQLTRASGRHPYVYQGCLSSAPPPPPVATALVRGLDALAAEFRLRGLGSLDFIATPDAAGYAVLEVNPRPSASMAVHGPGLVTAHLRACLHGILPTHAARPTGPEGGHALAGSLRDPVIAGPLRGHLVIYAPRAMVMSTAAAQALSTRDDVHDLPQPGTRCAAGAPLCSVSAQGTDATAVRRALDAAREDVLRTLSPLASIIET